MYEQEYEGGGEGSMNLQDSSDEFGGDEARGQFLIYQAEDGTLKLDVRLADETVWLTQKLLAELFQRDVRTISEYIKKMSDCVRWV